MTTEDRKFEEVEEVKEDASQEESTEAKVEDGVVIYQTEAGALGYNFIGEPTIKDVTYYLRLLEEITNDLWKAELASGRHTQEGQVDVDAQV